MTESRAVVSVENTRTKEEFYESRYKESPEYHSGNRWEHFFACIRGSEHEWQESENRWECRHRNRDNAFEGSLENSIFIKWESLFETEMPIVVDEHDTISRYYSHESDESDKMSRRHDSSSEPYSDHPSEPSSDDPEKYLKYEYYASEVPIEDSKERDKYADRYDREESGWLFLSCIESFIGYPVFFRNTEGGNLGLDIIDDGYDRAILCISWDDDTTLGVLMIDDISSLRERYIGDTSDEYTPLRGEWKRDTSDCFYSIGPVSGKLEYHRIGVLSVDDSCNFLSSDADIEDRLHFRIADILWDQSRNIGTNVDTWDFCLWFETHIERSLDGICYFEYFFSESFQLIEIRTKNLDHQWSPDTWDDLFDAMGDRLTDTDNSDFLVFSDDHIDFFVYSVFVFVCDFWKKGDFDLGIIGPLSMSIRISSSEYCSCSSDSLYFDEFFTEFFCYTDGIVERTSGFRRDRDRIAWFIERWESLLSCHHISEDSKWNWGERDEKSEFRISETPENWFFCQCLESMGEPCVLFDMSMSSLDPWWKEITTDHRNQCHRCHEWHDHRDHICHTDRSEDFAIDTWEHKKRYKYDELENGRIDDTSSDFFRGFIDDLEWMDTLILRKESIETKSSKNILHIDDRIIYELSDSDRESSEYHDIDTDSEYIKYYSC